MPEEITVYPHVGIAILNIAKVWIGCIIGIFAILWAGSHIIPPEIGWTTNLGAFLLLCGGVLFAIQQLMHYSNTYLRITSEAIIYKRGWIPSTTDNIFWVNIKDINSSTSITESLLGTGSIIIVVALRNEIYTAKIGYLPNHEAICTLIRDRIGKLSADTRQVTYT